MSDLTITPGDVLFVSGNKVTWNAGVAILAGKVIYPDSGSVWQLANNSMSIRPFISLNDAVVGQPVTAIEAGVVDIGAVLVQGMPLFISPNGGMISDSIADILTTKYVTVIGYPAQTANYLTISPYLIPYALA